MTNEAARIRRDHLDAHHKQLTQHSASAGRTSSLQHLKDPLNPEPDTILGIGTGALAAQGGWFPQYVIRHGGATDR